MTRSLDDNIGLSAPDVKVLADIREPGWHVTGVFAAKDETGPEWAFSIGLFHSFGHPEVIVLGLKLNACINVINEIGQQVKTGKRYQTNEDYEDILNAPYKCAFRTVERTHYRDYLGYALWFYENDPFPTMQCFWPDKTAKFPWDEGCNAFIKDAQPFLFIP
ncbi:MAG: DUF4262 domain-containing protein [Candidatus Acidiferrales bacterium]